MDAKLHVLSHVYNNSRLCIKPTRIKYRNETRNSLQRYLLDQGKYDGHVIRLYENGILFSVGIKIRLLHLFCMLMKWLEELWGLPAAF